MKLFSNKRHFTLIPSLLLRNREKDDLNVNISKNIKKIQEGKCNLLRTFGNISRHTCW